MHNKNNWTGIVTRLAATSATLAVMAGTAAAADRANQISLSFSDRDDRFGINLSYMHALAGNFSDEGMIVRFGVSSGDSDDGDSSRSVDALVGYQFLVGDLRVRTFGGLTYVEQDTGNAVGLKVSAQVQTKKSDDIYFNSTASYSAPKEQFAATLQIGGQLAGVVVGPELGVTSNPDITRTRLGLFLTGVKLGDVGFTFRAGYSFASEGGGSLDTPYYGVSSSLTF